MEHARTSKSSQRVSRVELVRTIPLCVGGAKERKGGPLPAEFFPLMHGWLTAACYLLDSTLRRGVLGSVGLHSCIDLPPCPYLDHSIAPLVLQLMSES